MGGTSGLHDDPLIGRTECLGETGQCGLDEPRLEGHPCGLRVTFSSSEWSFAHTAGRDMLQCMSLLVADIVAKVFSGWRTKILRAADAFRARRREGPYRLTQNRPRTLVAALQSAAAAERSNNQHSRDFRSRSIFDFCNSICHNRTHTPQQSGLFIRSLRRRGRAAAAESSGRASWQSSC